uniref:Uncharacterized protein n=1 Tax=Rhizophora mucronata TaxID=61149 RepID=A0A2P2QNF4_RHIMU
MKVFSILLKFRWQVGLLVKTEFKLSALKKMDGYSVESMMASMGEMQLIFLLGHCMKPLYFILIHWTRNQRRMPLKPSILCIRMAVYCLVSIVTIVHGRKLLQEVVAISNI